MKKYILIFVMGGLFSLMACGTSSTTTETTDSTTNVTIYEVELCGGGDGPYKITLDSGDFPAGVGQAYKLTGGGYEGFNGINCWEVKSNGAVNQVDYSNVVFGVVSSNCMECQNEATNNKK